MARKESLNFLKAEFKKISLISLFLKQIEKFSEQKLKFYGLESPKKKFREYKVTVSMWEST